MPGAEEPVPRSGQGEPVCSVCGFFYEPAEGVFVCPDSRTSYFVCRYCLRDIIDDLVSPGKPGPFGKPSSAPWPMK